VFSLNVAPPSECCEHLMMTTVSRLCCV